MNEDTRIAVCCYAGDQHQIIKTLGVYLHHQRPVVILSPEDSPAIINYPGIENRTGGKRCYIGQDSLDRQRRHLEILLEFPEKYFLIHDADSMCLEPKIPAYLYEEPDHVWSNIVNDGIPEHQAAYPPGFPHLAFQPPYFLSRATIEKLLSVAGEIRANPVLPFIDHYMIQLALKFGASYRSFRDGVSCPISWDPPSKAVALNGVRTEGLIFIHSVKRKEDLDDLLAARADYLRQHPG
jgi:hypothetical protein